MPIRHPIGNVEKTVGYNIIEFSGDIWVESWYHSDL